MESIFHFEGCKFLQKGMGCGRETYRYSSRFASFICMLYIVLFPFSLEKPVNMMGCHYCD
jgi:hypothetical protein